MKKLALLLAALGVVSAAAYAAPELTVTNSRTRNRNRKRSLMELDLIIAWLFNNVGLDYGDWSFGLQAGKQWGLNLMSDENENR